MQLKSYTWTADSKDSILDVITESWKLHHVMGHGTVTRVSALEAGGRVVLDIMSKAEFFIP